MRCVVSRHHAILHAHWAISLQREYRRGKVEQYQGGLGELSIKRMEAAEGQGTQRAR